MNKLRHISSNRAIVSARDLRRQAQAAGAYLNSSAPNAIGGGGGGFASRRGPTPGSATQPFFVLVSKDSGSDGDPDTTTECTWKYEVRDLDDSTVLPKNAAGALATGITPETPRMHYAHYWYAGETRTGATGDTTSRYGLACYDIDGDLHLLICFGEILEETVCAT